MMLAAQAQAQAPASFCERLAEQTGMTATTEKGESVWSTRVMNLAQRFLVGGTAMVTMRMTPSDDTVPADYPRLSDACKPVGKVLACAIEGPAEYELNVNGKESKVRAAAGEKARVEMKGTRLTCRNE